MSVFIRTQYSTHTYISTYNPARCIHAYKHVYNIQRYTYAHTEALLHKTGPFGPKHFGALMILVKELKTIGPIRYYFHPTTNPSFLSRLGTHFFVPVAGFLGCAMLMKQKPRFKCLPYRYRPTLMLHPHVHTCIDTDTLYIRMRVCIAVQKDRPIIMCTWFIDCHWCRYLPAWSV